MFSRKGEEKYLRFEMGVFLFFKLKLYLGLLEVRRGGIMFSRGLGIFR